MKTKQKIDSDDQTLLDAEQQYLVTAQHFLDELCRASQRRAASEGIVLGGFVVPRGLTRRGQRDNLFVVVGFGPMVYHGVHNGLTAYAPDDTWIALLRAISPSGHYTRDSEVYRWYSHHGRYRRYPGHKNVKPVHLKAGVAIDTKEP